MWDTLIARKIGEALKARPPKIINGPEILNKYVGGSEEKIREQFADAEEEYRKLGEDSELHIIIFDEIEKNVLLVDHPEITLVLVTTLSINCLQN